MFSLSVYTYTNTYETEDSKHKNRLEKSDLLPSCQDRQCQSKRATIREDMDDTNVVEHTYAQDSEKREAQKIRSELVKRAELKLDVYVY